jgi:phage/plasmid-associated DNA primase
LRRLIIEEGRNFSPSKNFAFQRVKADTNIIGFEDLRENFPFDKLFSIITDGIPVERKNKDEIFIGFNESPKVVITTNFSIKGIDDSTLDREFIIEFSDFYNRHHRPIDDFGKLFFENSWDESEWSDFFSFMIECFQFYLKNGLVAYEYVNLEKKNLNDMTCQEFAEFAESNGSGFEPGKEYDKKELYENFKKEYEEFDPKGTGKLSQSKFTRWLKVWGRIKNLEVKEGKSGAKRTIIFIGNVKSEAA